MMRAAVSQPGGGILPSRGDMAPSLREWLYAANLVTYLRLLAVPAVLYVVYRGHCAWGLALFLAAGVSDGLDGWIARRFDQRSRIGATLDPVADKLLLSLLFIELSLLGVIPWAVTLLVFIRDACISVSAVVLYVHSHFSDFAPVWWGKANTTAQLATLGVALLAMLAPGRALHAVEAVTWGCVVVFSLVSGIDYAFVAAGRCDARRRHA